MPFDLLLWKKADLLWQIVIELVSITDNYNGNPDRRVVE